MRRSLIHPNLRELPPGLKTSLHKGPKYTYIIYLASSKVTGGAVRRKSAGRRKRDRLPPRDDTSPSSGPLLLLLGRFLLMYFLYLPRAKKSPPMTPELRTGGS